MALAAEHLDAQVFELQLDPVAASEAGYRPSTLGNSGRE